MANVAQIIAWEMGGNKHEKVLKKKEDQKMRRGKKPDGETAPEFRGAEKENGREKKAAKYFMWAWDE